MLQIENKGWKKRKKSILEKSKTIRRMVRKEMREKNGGNISKGKLM